MTTSEKTKIGILIPTYNRRDYLAQALASAREQTRANLEIIVIDNGSSDGTDRLMASFSDPRVSYVVNEHNIGMIGSITRGIDLFSGEVEWCMVLADDDVLDPGFTAHMMTFLEERPSLLVAYGHIVFMDEHRKKIRDAVEGPEIETALPYLKARAFMRRETYLSATFFRKKAFTAIGGYPPFATGWGTDEALLFHLAAKGQGVGYSGDSLCLIRLHEKAESVLSPAGLETTFETALEFKDYCKNVGRTYGINQDEIVTAIDLKIKGFLYMLLTTQYQNDLKFRREHGKYDIFLRILRDAYPYLPFRVKLDYRCFSILGIALERYLLYRFCWSSIGNIYKLIRKLLPLDRFVNILHT